MMDPQIIICPICLRTDRNLKSIDSMLSVYHDELTDYSLGTQNSKYCGDCEWLLKKSYNFYQKCIKATKILKKWMKITTKNKLPANQLYLKLPQGNLDMWTPENNKVHTYTYSGDFKTPTLIIDGTTDKPHKIIQENVKMLDTLNIFTVKEEDSESTIDCENMFQTDIHCEDHQTRRVFEANENFNNDSQDTTNIFQNKVMNDMVILNAGSSGTHKGINKSKLSENTGNDMLKQANDTNTIQSKTRQCNIEENIHVKKSKNTDDKTKPIENQKATHNMPKVAYTIPTLTQDMLMLKGDKPKLKNDIQIPTNNVPILLENVTILTHNTPILTNKIPDITTLTDNVTNDSQIKSSLAEDTDLIVLDDEDDDDSKDDVIVIDDEIEYPDDASLNSADDCDDYLYTPRKKPKMKITLDEMANISLTDEDFDDDLEPDNIIDKKKIGLKPFTTENNIVSKLKAMNNTLNSLCENWEVTSLIDVGIPNISKDKVKEFIHQYLTLNDLNIQVKVKRFKMNNLKKTSVNAKLTHIDADLGLINEKCVQLVEDYKNGLTEPIERLKAELLQKYEEWGVLKAEDGFVFDKEVILSCLHMVSERAARRLIYYLKGTKRLSPGAAKCLKQIQSKQDHDKYKSIFNIEYMTTEQQMLDEFENRKTYKCYLLAEFKCEICYQGFKHKRLLEYHKKCHEDRPGSLLCNICHTRHYSQSSLKSHMTTHEAVFKCKLCPLLTYYKLSMINHFQQHNGMVYKCELCGNTYKSKSVYLHHQSRAHPRGSHVCTICGNSFISQLGLNTHMFRKHRDENRAGTENSVTCAACNLVFPTLEACFRHERTAHGLSVSAIKPKTSERRPPRLTKPRRKPVLTCRVCNAEGHSYGWLMNHFTTEHPTVNRASLYADKLLHLCDMCGKGFVSKYNLREHIGTHMGVSVPCPSCPKRFRSMLALRRHRLTHGPPKFCCERCGKKFNSHSNLYNHMRSHIGDRRFKCSICGKGFLHLCSLRIHIKGVHNHERRIRRRGKNLGNREETDPHGIDVELPQIADIETQVDIDTAEMIINPE